jgi:O-glycosyl hydrolase
MTPAQPAYTTTVNPGTVLVTNFEGWGTSLCWWANVVGGYTNRSDYASLAFSTLKLNIVRYNIGGGENPDLYDNMPFRTRLPGFEPSPGVWDWNADQNQRWMLRQAIALGANRVVAFANSPPWWMTISGSVTGATNGTSNNLNPAYEMQFADYLATVVSNLTILDGVHFDYVTPINEPTGNWTSQNHRQEGCHMSPTQQARVVAALRSALDVRNIKTGIDAPEDPAPSDAVNSINIYGPIQTNVALLTTHTYPSKNPIAFRNLAATLHKPAWMSEYGDGDASGMTLARRIHDDITGMLVRAWVHWQIVDGGGWGFIDNPLNGKGDTAYTFNKKFYVMAQFSQFIRPGFQIIKVNDANSLAAFQPINQTLVIVAFNNSANTINVTYNLNAFATLPAQVSAVRTSPLENEAPLSMLSLTNASFIASLVPKSVTTFTLTGAKPSLN